MSRPLSDRVEGLDAVLRPLDASTSLRFAVAALLARHGDLLDLLADGGTTDDALAQGLVAFWPDHAEVRHGLPLRGAELLPCAAAALALLDDPTAVLDEARRVHPLVRDGDTLAHAVLTELLDALVLAALDAPPPS